MFDHNLVATLADRTRYKAYISAVPMDELGTTTKWLLNSFGKFFQDNPNAKQVDYSILETMARLKLDGEESSPVIKLINKAREVKVTKEQMEATVSILTDMQYAGKVAQLVNRYNDGDEIDLPHEIYMETQRMRNLKGQSAESLFIEPDIHEILEEQAKDDGLKFRQIPLQEHIKGLVPPVNVAIAAGSDSGKTSFIADALTYMAPQCTKRYPDRPIIWLSNEGVSREIWPRIYASALGKDALEMAKLSRDKLYSEYAKALGGKRNIIKVLDIHGWSMAQIAALIEEMKPIIVVIDMLANVRLAGVEKRHERVEALAQELRELEAIHDFIGISTFQLSADGLNQMFPPMDAIKDTKIGMQGAMDVILMMGRLNDTSYAQNRWLSTPKNKRKMVGKPGNVQAEVFFQPDISRFIDG
ncbi:DNA helicase [Salmonella phage vB_SpuP_Spp16]|uniref:DNA helicase n=1 Tax=Salmonella phage vB_SpuP_Spp16 TaxID=2081603 RepID=A0A2P9JZS8_9CAUD|nr:DNA helicase [Salmonella phage vB_SpuP_Spp16]AVI05043.1 DNA helicase [Salmonella phage vB_SpuP_Spp16]